MKIVFITIFAIFLMQRQSDAGVVRKPPAFATPVYSNSYLPAAMQVIFHAVDQLKHLEAEETVSTSPTTTIALPTTSPHAPGQHQPSAEEVSTESTDSAAYEASTASIASMTSTAYELSTDVSEASSVFEALAAATVSEASSVSEAVTDAADSELSIDSDESDASAPSAASDASAPSAASDASASSAASDASAPSAASDASALSAAADASAPSAASDASAASPTASDASSARDSLDTSDAPAASTASKAVACSVISSTVSKDSIASIADINPTGSTPTFINIIKASQPLPPVPEHIGETNEEKPEVMEEITAVAESDAETPEQNYATPEINHEVQETGQEEIESNQDILEKNESEEQSRISILSTRKETVDKSASTALPTFQYDKDSSVELESEKSSSEESNEKSSESESKISSESKSHEDESSEEEEDDEIRFTLIGEKVSQVPRPSLSNYLRKTARAPLRGSVQDLATLYDSLSKDARKQGLGKYAGYSDEVLQTLESSIEGGVGPQLRTLLEKAQARNELTRDDAKNKLSVALKKLADPASILSRDLRRLIPLRYIP